MNGSQYARKLYYGFPTYEKIAKDGFNAGLHESKPSNEKKLEEELKAVKEELKSLWETIENPDKFAELLEGM